MRIAFLFNHDQVHQVAHSLPICIALADQGFPGEIVVATTSPALAAEVRRMGGTRIGTTIEHVELTISSASRRIDALAGRLMPARKLLIYRDNLAFFRGIDVLVVAEKTSLILKRLGLTDLKIVHTRHGAGDRAIGFDAASAAFDHVLCSGPKIRDRLIQQAGVAPGAVTIVGYPKFDLVRDAPPVRYLPTAGMVVLYNPHPAPHLSSWYRHGRAVFEQCARNDRLGLLFAPHVMLFQRGLVVTIDPPAIARPGRLPAEFLRGDRIKIDLGSSASTDMRYTLSSDVYLGDASSQVYEFLMKPRPCIFLNSRRHRWQSNPDFLHWTAGEVIDRPGDLPRAIARAEELHATRYARVQQRLFAETFDLNEQPSAMRAAAVIADVAERDQARGSAEG